MGGKNRYLILAWGTVTFLLLGLLYSWSKFAPAIRAEFGYTQAQITLAYTLSMVTFALGITADGFLAKVKSPRFLACLGTLLAGGGYLLTSLVPGLFSGLIYLSYGVFVGFGIGLCYNVWLTTVMNWFPERKGFASGLVLLGMGFSGFLVVPPAAGWLRAFGWRPTFRILALLILAEGLLALCFLRQAPSGPAGSRTPEADPSVNLSTPEVIRQPSFVTAEMYATSMMSYTHEFDDEAFLAAKGLK